MTGTIWRATKRRPMTLIYTSLPLSIFSVTKFSSVIKPVIFRYFCHLHVREKLIEVCLQSPGAEIPGQKFDKNYYLLIGEFSHYWRRPQKCLHTLRDDKCRCMTTHHLSSSNGFYERVITHLSPVCLSLTQYKYKVYRENPTVGQPYKQALYREKGVQEPRSHHTTTDSYSYQPL